MLYGTHPYALSSMVEPESIAALRRDELVGFYRAHYRADHAVIALIGDVTTAQAREIAARLTSALPRAEGEPQPLPAVAMPKGETRKIAHPATQSHILIGQPGMARNDPDYFPLFVGNYVLGGGGFASRLIEEVRQKRGLAYSVYSYFIPLQQRGPFQIGLQTKREQADEALAVVRKTLGDFIAKGPTEDELKRGQAESGGRLPAAHRQQPENPRLPGRDRLLPAAAFLSGRFHRQGGKSDGCPNQGAFTRRIQPDSMVTVVVGADEAN